MFPFRRFLVALVACELNCCQQVASYMKVISTVWPWNRPLRASSRQFSDRNSLNVALGVLFGRHQAWHNWPLVFGLGQRGASEKTITPYNPYSNTIWGQQALCSESIWASLGKRILLRLFTHWLGNKARKCTMECKPRHLGTAKKIKECLFVSRLKHCTRKSAGLFSLTCHDPISMATARKDLHGSHTLVACACVIVPKLCLKHF